MRGELYERYLADKADFERRLGRQVGHIQFMAVLLRLYELSTQKADERAASAAGGQGR